MRCTITFSGLVASVLLISGTAASPCKPKTTQQSSWSLVSSATESSQFESVSTADATSTIAEILSTSTAAIVEATSTDATSIDAIPTEATSTEAPSESTSEVTTEDSANTTGLTTATTETTADTTTWVIPTSEATADTTTLFTETSTTEPSTTSEAPPSITTFSLVSGNSALSQLNGNILQFRTNLPSTLSLRPPNELFSSFETAYFSVEPRTNYLKMGSLYVVSSELRQDRISAANDDSQARYILCTPPTALGQRLSCFAESSRRTRWMTLSSGLYIRSGEEIVGPNEVYYAIDLIVS